MIGLPFIFEIRENCCFPDFSKAFESLFEFSALGSAIANKGLHQRNSFVEKNGGTMKKNIERPWLTGSGVEIPTLELKEINRTWDAKTWEAYLKWYSGTRQEELVTPSLYQEIGEEQFESIFESHAKSETPAKRNLIERLLSQLHGREAEILRATFLEGRTQVEIAAEFGLSQPRICQIKNSGLRTLKQGLAGDKLIARRFMRGADNYERPKETALWDQPMVPPPMEARFYDPNNFEDEIRNLKNHSLRVALLRLSPKAQEILFLRFWCNQSIRQIARRLQIGMNSVCQICHASVAKVKRLSVQFQTGLEL
jgi:RNA polymerase sigma factor (sigma-70 family)